MSGQFVLLGRGNAYYSDMLRWKRLPFTGVKRDVQARVLRYVLRVATGDLRRRRRERVHALAYVLGRLPAGPSSAVGEFVEKGRTPADYQRTFMHVFGRQRAETSFAASFPGEPDSAVLIVGQGVDSDGDGIRAHTTLVKIKTGEILHRIDLDDVSLVELSAKDWSDNQEMLYYASAASNAYDERNFLKNELDFLECEEILLTQMCETMSG